MRQKARAALEQMVHCAVADSLIDHEQHAADQLNRLYEAVQAVKPVYMDMTQELADDIARKLHGPLTISEETSDWFRQIARHSDQKVISPFGYGPDGGSLDITVRTDGTLHLIIKDQYGAYRWQGTFSPPSYQHKGDDL